LEEQWLPHDGHRGVKDGDGRDGDGKLSTSTLGWAAVFSGELPRWKGWLPASAVVLLYEAACGGLWRAATCG
jgi:hypothetical protein